MERNIKNLKILSLAYCLFQVLKKTLIVSYKSDKKFVH